MTIYLCEPSSYGVRVQFEVERIVVDTRTPYQDLKIVDSTAYGRVLVLDGFVQSSVRDEALYHEALVHPAMVIHGAPANILVGGTGEGASLREILRHPSVERVLTCDLDDAVVQAVREHMPEMCAGVFEDPRVEYRVEDVRKTIAEADDGEFDIVFLDVTDPVEDGPAAELFSLDWFERVARVLDDDGIVVVQSGEIDVATAELPRGIRTTLRQVFMWTQTVHTYVPSFHALWTFTLAARRPIELRPADLRARIAKIPSGELRVYTERTHHAMLELPPFLRELIERDGAVIRGPASDSVQTYHRDRQR